MSIRDLPGDAFAADAVALGCETGEPLGADAPSERRPSRTIVELAVRTTERLAVLDRVRPILEAAIAEARGFEAERMCALAVKLTNAIVKGE